jgi:hypothetical protein
LRNASESEITKGLTEGAEVILHPANDLKVDVRVLLLAVARFHSPHGFSHGPRTNAWSEICVN